MTTKEKIEIMQHYENDTYTKLLKLWHYGIQQTLARLNDNGSKTKSRKRPIKTAVSQKRRENQTTR